jgi:hypothetical protein
MLHIAFYLVALAACAGFAFARGGPPEKTVAAMFLIATALTFAAQATLKRGDFGRVETGVFLVDCALLIGLLAVAILSTRFWPLWLTAFQLVPVASHGVKLFLAQAILPNAYATALAFWAYPMLAILALGVWRHRRRMARDGADDSWLSWSHRLHPPRR